MKTIKDYMTENKDYVIDLIQDEVRFTKTNLKEVANLLVQADSQFQSALPMFKADALFTSEDKAFKCVLKAIVDNIVIARIDANQEFWNMIENQVKRQFKAL